MRSGLCGKHALVGLLLVAVMGLSAGCRHHAAVSRQARLRQQSMQLVLDTISGSERSRAARMRRTWGVIEHNTEVDYQRIRYDADYYGAFLRADVQRWRQRQPAYRAVFERVMAGKPQRIEPNAIILFY